MERFIGILIEHYAGTLPAWLAPVQVVILNIADRHAEYANSVLHSLEKQGFRAKIDLRNEKIGFKIREHSMQRVPYLLIVGDKECETGTIAVRTQQGKDLGSAACEAFSTRLRQEIERRGL